MNSLKTISLAAATAAVVAGLAGCGLISDTWATADGGCGYPVQAAADGEIPMCDKDGSAISELKVNVTCLPAGIIEESIGVAGKHSYFGVAPTEDFAKQAGFGPNFERVESYNAVIPTAQRDVYTLTVTPPQSAVGNCSVDVLDGQDMVLFSNHNVTSPVTASFVIDSDPKTEENKDFSAPDDTQRQN